MIERITKTLDLIQELINSYDKLKDCGIQLKSEIDEVLHAILIEDFVALSERISVLNRILLNYVSIYNESSIVTQQFINSLIGKFEIFFTDFYIIFAHLPDINDNAYLNIFYSILSQISLGIVRLHQSYVGFHKSLVLPKDFDRILDLLSHGYTRLIFPSSQKDILRSQILYYFIPLEMAFLLIIYYFYYDFHKKHDTANRLLCTILPILNYYNEYTIPKTINLIIGEQQCIQINLLESLSHKIYLDFRSYYHQLLGCMIFGLVTHKNELFQYLSTIFLKLKPILLC